jgi:hypothetical protein
MSTLPRRLVNKLASILANPAELAMPPKLKLRSAENVHVGNSIALIRIAFCLLEPNERMQNSLVITIPKCE